MNTLPTSVSDRAPGAEKPSISCIVPALNEYDNLLLLLPALAELLEGISSAWEILLVDDGSKDATPQLMASLSATPGYRYIQLSRNFGKEAALTAGLEASTGDVVICLDADLQHPLSLIPDMVKRWNAGADMVYAVRQDRMDESWLKRIGVRVFYRILGSNRRIDIPENAGDFRLMDRRVVNALLNLPERTRFMKGLYAWVGFNTESIFYKPTVRVHGASNFHPFRLVSLAVDGITAFSTWPLHMLSVTGSLLALCSFGYGGYLVLDYLLHGHEVSGWTTIVTAMFFFSGINLLAFGTIGAYIGRIFDEVKQRPLYVIRQQLGQQNAENKK